MNNKFATKDGVQAVIFDYGGVLGRTVDHAPRHELERLLNLEPGELYKVVFESPLWNEAQVGRISSAEVWDDVGQRLGLNETESVMLRKAFWAGDRLDSELVAIIRQLRDDGYRTALLSNAPASARQRLEERGIADAFDVVVISGCEGVMKPDPAIFELTLERVGVAAEEAVFVDDSWEHVAAARQVGLRAVRFRGLTPLRHQLRDQGISVPDPVLTPLPDIQAIIFDWGGVLEGLPDDAHIAEWEQRLALKPGALIRASWGEVWRQFSVGAISEQDYVTHIVEQLGFPDADAGRRFLVDFYAGDRFYPQVANAVRGLQSRYQVALLSNASPNQASRVRESFGFDIDVEFDVYINSALVGLRKPDPAIFELTLEQLGIAPQQAIFVDDLVYNVDAARELGIHTVQFVDPETSLAELEALLGHPV